jgi:zinc transporter 5/7
MVVFHKFLMDKLLILAGALTGLTISECFIGMYTKNVHILRDFLLNLLLLASISASRKALQLSTSTPDTIFTMGYLRIDILSAFCNCIYIQCMELFELLETLHHMIEHWENMEHQD